MPLAHLAPSIIFVDQLWFPSTDRVDEGTRSSEPWSRIVRTLDAGNSPTRQESARRNSRRNEQILQSESPSTTGHESWRLGNVKCKKHSHQGTNEKIKSKNARPIQGIRSHKGERAFKLEISPRWKIPLIFHVLLLEPYRVSAREESEQPPRVQEDIKGELEWEVEKIVRPEVITYTRKFRRRDKEFKKLGSFLKCQDCAKDQNTWEPREGLENAREQVEEFYRQNPEMPGLAVVESRGKVFLMWLSKRMRFFTPTASSSKRI